MDCKYLHKQPFTPDTSFCAVDHANNNAALNAHSSDRTAHKSSYQSRNTTAMLCKSSLFAITSLVMSFTSTIASADILYVTSRSDDLILKYDISSNNVDTIVASESRFSNEVSSPNGLAVDSSGNLYAANEGASKIIKFSPSGKSLSVIGDDEGNREGGGSGGLAIDSAGNLYGANSDSIVKYSPTGEFQFKIENRDNLYTPRGLAFDSAGNLYATTQVFQTINKYSPSGKLLSKIGNRDSLNNPNGIAFDSAGNLYAANRGDGSISKFNSSGKFLSLIIPPMRQSGIVGLAFDANGNLYAAYSGSSTISKFSPSGKLLISWKTSSAPDFLAVSRSKTK